MDRYTDHGGPQDAPVKNIAGLKDLKDRAVVEVFRFGAIHGLMQMGIERLANRIESLDAEFCQVIEELLVDKLEAFAISNRFGGLLEFGAIHVLVKIDLHVFVAHFQSSPVAMIS